MSKYFSGIEMRFEFRSWFIVINLKLTLWHIPYRNLLSQGGEHVPIFVICILIYLIAPFKFKLIDYVVTCTGVCLHLLKNMYYKQYFCFVPNWLTRCQNYVTGWNIIRLCLGVMTFQWNSNIKWLSYPLLQSGTVVMWTEMCWKWR